MKKILVFAASSLLAFFPLLLGASYNSSSAQSYLLAHPSSPWATMALVASGASSIPDNHLKAVEGSAAIDYAAPILAITALGENPRTFASKDLVSALKGHYSGGQLGDASTINDDIFGLLALVASGETPESQVPKGVSDYIVANQNADGGWGFALGGGSDTNMTAAAILSLLSADRASSDPVIEKGLNYLKTAQNDDGGFTYDPNSQFGTASDTSSTAWVVWVLNALDITPSSWSKAGHSPTSYLESNQSSNGYFTYQTGSSEDSFSPMTTSYAVIALSGKALPLEIASSQNAAAKFPFRIEGSKNTVCEGEAAGPTALEVVKNAKEACGFTYEIKNTSFGPYLFKINDDAAAGMTGWLYLVNFASPPVGAADYQMQQGDSLLWYYGDFAWQPMRLALDRTTAASGESAKATVEYFSNGSWSPLAGATASFGTQSAVTDGSGKADILSPDGYYKVSAAKDGYIRSNSILLKVGQPADQAVNLSVNIGQVEAATTTKPSAIAFTVEPGSLDFGDMAAGSEESRDITIKNIGTAGIAVEAVVNGGAVFKDHLTVDSASWRGFKATAPAQENRTVPLRLSLPQNVQTPSGEQSGQIIFWASPIN